MSLFDDLKAAYQAAHPRDQLDFKAWLDGHPPMTDHAWWFWEVQGMLRRAGAVWGVRMGAGHVYYAGRDDSGEMTGQLTDYEDTGQLYDDRPVLLPAGAAFLAERGFEVPPEPPWKPRGPGEVPR